MTTTAPADAPLTQSAAPRGDPPRRWTRIGLPVLLAVTALTYLYRLDRSGYANQFYAAAVQAGTKSWKAMLFGSLDAADFITVDKPPAAMWVMALSGRVFGFSTWSMQVPQALMGVASVALLYAAVRRWAGPTAGLAAGAVLAFTPVAPLMFRFNDPDALLVLLMVAAAYAVTRAVDATATGAGARWLLLAGVFVGLGFLTKMLEVMLELPALAAVYLLAAPPRLPRRIGHLAAAGVAVIVSAGWYVALVELWPPADRPYVGGSTDNSLLQLALGYNGASRIFGRARPGAGAVTGSWPGALDVSGGWGAGFGGAGHGPGAPGGPSDFGRLGFGGAPGLTRLFGPSFADYIAWLLPAALLLLLAALWLTRHAPRDDRTRAGLVLWGGWLLVAAVVFSLMRGNMHPYYVLAMAPALAGTLAVGAAEVWRHRARWPARLTLCLGLLGTAIWSFALLGRAADFVPWLRWLVLVAGVVGGLALLVPAARRHPRAWASVLLATVLIGGLGGPAAISLHTVLSPERSAIISTSDSAPGPRPMAFSHPVDAQLSGILRAAPSRWSAATLGSQQAASLELATGTSVLAIGGFTGADPAPTLAEFQRLAANHQIRYFVSPIDEHHRSIAGMGGMGWRTPAGTGAEISDWVAARYPASVIGGYRVYDLS